MRKKTIELPSAPAVAVQRMFMAYPRPITGTFRFKDVDELVEMSTPRPWHEYYQAGLIAGINACRELLIRNALTTDFRNRRNMKQNLERPAASAEVVCKELLDIPRRPWLLSKQYGMTFALSQDNEIILGSDTCRKLGDDLCKYIIESVNVRMSNDKALT